MMRTTTPHTTQPPTAARRHDRDTPEFARLVNLSDAVFAIAMTLLVLTLEIPDVPAAELAAAMAADLPRFIAVVLGFALVANIWWQHHKLFAQLAWIEPGQVAIGLFVLGAVALVPFPTGLIGAAPTARAAVVPFITVFIVLNLLHLGAMARAQRLDAWTEPMPPGLFTWLVTGIGLVVLTMVAALIVTWWSPLGGLLVLAVSGLPERVLARRAPPGYAARC
jgi:uncharacterized membrane protein